MGPRGRTECRLKSVGSVGREMSASTRRDSSTSTNGIAGAAAAAAATLRGQIACYVIIASCAGFFLGRVVQFQSAMSSSWTFDRDCE